MVTTLIAETQRERAGAAALLVEADPADEAEVYRRLGLQLTYRPETRTVRAEIDPGEHRWGKVCVRGRIRTIPPYAPMLDLDMLLK